METQEHNSICISRWRIHYKQMVRCTRDESVTSGIYYIPPSLNTELPIMQMVSVQVFKVQCP